LGSSLLLPRPWAALLRLLLQQKVPAQTLKKLAGPVIMGEEEGLEEVIWACLPKITRAIWQQTPHRMYSAEAEVCCPFIHAQAIYRFCQAETSWLAWSPYPKMGVFQRLAMHVSCQCQAWLDRHLCLQRGLILHQYH